jgi:hypothetical protein
MNDIPTDTPPDRLSSNPRSPHYDAAILERGVGIRFKGVERTNVDEYCVSEGPLTTKLQGSVEPYFRGV